MITPGSPAQESAACRSQTDRVRNPGFSFTLETLDAGWASAVVKNDRYSAALTVSYVSDGLGHLLSAVAELAAGATETRCSWATEPGEYRWLFSRPGESVVVQIVGFADAEDPQPDAAGSIIIEFAVSLPALATSLVKAFQTHPHARSGSLYVERWGHPYPQAQLSVLRAFLTGTAP